NSETPHHTRCGCFAGVSVVIAAGKRPVPFRTRKLSLPAPMVLHPPGCGRVGHRRTTTSTRRRRELHTRSFSPPLFCALMAGLPSRQVHGAAGPKWRAVDAQDGDGRSFGGLSDGVLPGACRWHIRRVERARPAPRVGTVRPCPCPRCLGCRLLGHPTPGPAPSRASLERSYYRRLGVRLGQAWKILRSEADG